MYLEETCCSIHSTDVDDLLIPLKKEGSWETLKRAWDIKNHDFSNLVFERHQLLPTMFYHWSCYQHCTMKSSLERINAANTKRLELDTEYLSVFSPNAEKYGPE